MQARTSQLKFDARTRSPIGCLDWPAGRVLLQWALDHLPAGSTTLEVGSGIGTVSVGLACANRDVVATDVDEEALELLRSNAALNGATLAVSQWDASLGESAVPGRHLVVSTGRRAQTNHWQSLGPRHAQPAVGCGRGPSCTGQRWLPRSASPPSTCALLGRQGCSSRRPGRPQCG